MGKGGREREKVVPSQVGTHEWTGNIVQFLSTSPLQDLPEKALDTSHSVHRMFQKHLQFASSTGGEKEHPASVIKLKWTIFIRSLSVYPDIALLRASQAWGVLLLILLETICLKYAPWGKWGQARPHLQFLLPHLSLSEDTNSLELLHSWVF